jgi:hypothetical protein
MTRQSPSPSRRRGQSLLEFTFVGIPIMFVLISIFEISRGMWVYHTLAYSVKAGVRYALVHGINCVPAPFNNNICTKTIANVAQVIQDAGVGLDTGDSKTLLTFTDGAGAQTTCFLGGATNPCSGKAATWPPGGGNSVGRTIRIDIVTPFRSAIVLFWPGAKPVSFGVFDLPASSSDVIQF